MVALCFGRIRTRLEVVYFCFFRLFVSLLTSYLLNLLNFTEFAACSKPQAEIIIVQRLIQERNVRR